MSEQNNLYRVGALAKELGKTTRTLRFYEQPGFSFLNNEVLLDIVCMEKRLWFKFNGFRHRDMGFLWRYKGLSGGT